MYVDPCSDVLLTWFSFGTLPEAYCLFLNKISVLLVSIGEVSSTRIVTAGCWPRLTGESFAVCLLLVIFVRLGRKHRIL